ncbi:hypothetical protein HETIRDRAFT_445554 [Heterobasidion irregulare TC 32-1]|uniref:Uncharacterized protein n=1 Tax=Heterobasidion irregulare (strain TC 32-1) TaxID=747525 RepID=W4K2A3_HETIT|nr:uncharacterized protein HETIRDRAFT_445554 [Heterobasidion irregulare TC 32-1]ETW79849.1 hypothetical protein HETIRDRAFT_445554 [Heterobasidion irregulare TC 32-1]
MLDAHSYDSFPASFAEPEMEQYYHTHSSPSKLPQQMYNPPYSPSAFTFDPFAEDDDIQTSSSSDSHSPVPQSARTYGDRSYSQLQHSSRQQRGQQAGGEVQRHQKVEFLRQREWMRRVVAWVDHVNSGIADHHHYFYTPSPSALAPDTLYYSSKEPEPDLPLFDEEPYLIYSTPVPNSTSSQTSFGISGYIPPSPVSIPFSSPVPSISPSTIAPVKASPGRRVHSRVPSLDSIREEDEDVSAKI